MAYQDIVYPQDTTAFYQTLKQQLDLYTADAPDALAALANSVSVLMAALPDINWVGFYLVRGRQLVLGPFQGRPAVMTIEKGQGVCGTAWETGAPQIVADVHCFSGHIACDLSSRSELVLPVMDDDGHVLAVLDVDSASPNRFSSDDAAGLALTLAVLRPAITRLATDLAAMERQAEG